MKLLLIATFVGLATIKLKPIDDALDSQLSPLNFASSLVWIYLAYSGWNAAVYVAGEIKVEDFKRRSPFSTDTVSDLVPKQPCSFRAKTSLTARALCARSFNPPIPTRFHPPQ